MAVIELEPELGMFYSKAVLSLIHSDRRRKATRRADMQVG